MRCDASSLHNSPVLPHHLCAQFSFAFATDANDLVQRARLSERHAPCLLCVWGGGADSKGIYFRRVVVPSLTPDNYNRKSEAGSTPTVVVPSLTPDNYNVTDEDEAIREVVVPSLTPDNYNHPCRTVFLRLVVVPSLTPDNYNHYFAACRYSPVVVPSLTPDNYNR